MSSQTAAAGRLTRVTELPERTLVRLALGLDAAVTGVNGVAYIALAGALDGPLGLEAETLRALGAFLVVFALGVGLLAARPVPPRLAVLAVVDVNIAWAVVSVVALAFGWADPETLGGVWIALQALVVGAFAALQAVAQRRADRG